MKVFSNPKNTKGYERYEKFLNVLCESGKISKEKKDEWLQKGEQVLSEMFLQKGKEYLEEKGKKLKKRIVKREADIDDKEGEPTGLIEEGGFEGGFQNISEADDANLRARFKKAMQLRKRRMLGEEDNLNENIGEGLNMTMESQKPVKILDETIGQGNLVNASLLVSDAHVKIWELENYTFELYAPKVSNISKWDATIRYNGILQDTANFKTEDEAKEWLNNYNLAESEMDRELHEAMSYNKKIKMLKKLKGGNVNLKTKRLNKEGLVHDPISIAMDDPDFVPTKQMSDEELSKKMAKLDWPGTHKPLTLKHDAMLGNYEDLDDVGELESTKPSYEHDAIGGNTPTDDLNLVASELEELFNAKDVEGIATILAPFSDDSQEDKAEIINIFSSLDDEGLSWVFMNLSNPGCSPDCFHAAKLAQNELWRRRSSNTSNEFSQIMTEAKQPINEVLVDDEENDEYTTYKFLARKKATGEPWVLGDTTEKIYRELQSKYGAVTEAKKKNSNKFGRFSKPKDDSGSASGERAYNIDGKDRMEYEDNELVEASEYMTRKYPARLKQDSSKMVDTKPTKSIKNNLSRERLGNYLKNKESRAKQLKEQAERRKKLLEENKLSLNEEVKKN